MSAYTNQTAILGEIQLSDLIALTDDAPKMGVVNQTVLDQVIANASGEIDRFVGNIYDVPFTTVPPSVANMALIIACYRLFRRREVPDEKNKFSDDYYEVRDFLKAVHKREDVLDLSAAQDFPQVAIAARDTIYGAGNNLANTM